MTESLLMLKYEEQLAALRFLQSDEFKALPNKVTKLHILNNLPNWDSSSFLDWSMVADESVIDHDRFFYGHFFECTFVSCEFTNIRFLGEFSNCKFIDCKFTNCFFGRSTISNTFEVDFTKTQFNSCVFENCTVVHASFYRADFYASNVRFSNIFDSNFRCIDLTKSDLRIGFANDANFTGVHIADSEFDINGHSYCGLDSVCPESGEFVAYKHVISYHIDDKHRCYAKYIVAKLIIPENAQRSSAFTRKCRASEALVVGFYDRDGYPLSDEFINTHYFVSFNDRNFFYKLNEKVIPDSFSTNRWKECAPGIHFFMTFNEAANY